LRFVETEFHSQIEVKKSKFIAHLCPYSEFDTMMERLKNEHPKARHYVYAYRYLNEFEQIVENSSDDGEPKGTSGRPCLKVLSGGDIINSAVIVVRYFGGTMLGTGGLVKAYSDAVNAVIEVSEFTLYEKLEEKEITVSYTELAKIEHTLKALEITIKTKEFGDDVVLTLQATKEKLEKFEY
jgi:uncharacterized YigZ family protein